jgi:hypothetical protein
VLILEEDKKQNEEKLNGWNLIIKNVDWKWIWTRWWFQGVLGINI